MRREGGEVTGRLGLIAGTAWVLLGLVWFAGTPISDAIGWRAIDAFWALCGLAGLAALVSLHRPYRHEYGLRGRIGLWIAIVGTAIFVLGTVASAATGSESDLVFVAVTLGYLLVFVGSAVVGVSFLRAGVASRTGSILFVLALPLGLLLAGLAGITLASTVSGFDVEGAVAAGPPVLYGLGWLAIGARVRTEPDRQGGL